MEKHKFFNKQTEAVRAASIEMGLTFRMVMIFDLAAHSTRMQFATGFRYFIGTHAEFLNAKNEAEAFLEDSPVSYSRPGGELCAIVERQARGLVGESISILIGQNIFSETFPLDAIRPELDTATEKEVEGWLQNITKRNLTKVVFIN